MNGLLQFIRLFSALSLFTAAFWVLVPKGRGEKTARRYTGEPVFQGFGWE